MKFKTQYTERKIITSNPGSPIKEEYQLRIIDNAEEVVLVGKSNFQEYIQSHADSVDLHKILERCALLDDYSILNRMPADFMDVTEAPKNLAQAYAMVKDAENFFERMPVEIKEKYDNNFVEFIDDIGSDYFLKNVSKFLDSIKEKEEVTVENES